MTLKNLSALLVAPLVAVGFIAPDKEDLSKAPKHETIYDFTMKDIKGKDVKLSQFKGKTLLIVNTASKCGLTPQYEGLESLYKQYKSKGLVVLGFPANEFMGQEPGTNEEIAQFCSATYNVTFPMFSKIVVKGNGANPLYLWLISKSGREDAIEWNFAKFLVGPDGKVKARFSPKTKPGAEEIVKAIEANLPK